MFVNTKHFRRLIQGGDNGRGNQMGSSHLKCQECLLQDFLQPGQGWGWGEGWEEKASIASGFLLFAERAKGIHLGQGCFVREAGEVSILGKFND